MHVNFVCILIEQICGFLFLLFKKFVIIILFGTVRFLFVHGSDVMYFMLVRKSSVTVLSFILIFT